MSSNRKKVSMQDIADNLGISKNAVSLALADKPGVGEELKKKIIKTAHDMNYSGFEKIRRKKSNNIFVLIPEYIRNDTYFYNDIYWSIENEAKQRGYNAILSRVSPDMEKSLALPNLYFELDISGIMIIGIFTEAYVEKLLETRLPILSVDHYYDDITLDTILTANEEGAYKAVKHLIENGHRDIGYIGAIKITSSFYERWSGYNKAMLNHGLTVDPGHCVLESSPLDSLFSDPDELDRYIGRMKSFPTAWFCGNDRVAIALVNLLNRKNISVPDEISIVGFDDIEAASIITPPLTTVRINRGKIGKESVDFLIRRIEDKDGERQRMALYGELIIRKSVRSIVE